MTCSSTETGIPFCGFTACPMTKTRLVESVSVVHLVDLTLHDVAQALTCFFFVFVFFLLPAPTLTDSHAYKCAHNGVCVSFHSCLLQATSLFWTHGQFSPLVAGGRTDNHLENTSFMHLVEHPFLRAEREDCSCTVSGVTFGEALVDLCPSLQLSDLPCDSFTAM